MNLKQCLLAAGIWTMGFAAMAQGSLTPPGLPGPVMKSLDQIEARTPVPASLPAIVPILITEPGSYYLTRNLILEGITEPVVPGMIIIASSDVTLDLNGFAIIGQPLLPAQQSGSGIEIGNSQSGVTIKNGSIRGWGGAGIDAGGAFACSVRDVSLIGNGINDEVADAETSPSLVIGRGGIVENCRAHQNRGAGFELNGAILRDSTAHDNGADGVVVRSDSMVERVISQRNDRWGINVEELTSGAVVRDCIVNWNGGIGIFLRVNSRGNRIQGNTMYANSGAGLRALGDGNLIVQNAARANADTGSLADEYDIIDADESWGGVIDGSAGSQFVTDRPWINFYSN